MAGIAAGKPRSRPGNDWRYLEYGRWTRLLALALVPLAICLTFSPIGIPGQAAIAAAADCLAAFMVYETWVRKLRWNREELQSIHPFGTVSIPWRMVPDLRATSAFNLARIANPAGGRIWVPLTPGARLLSKYMRKLERAFLFNVVLGIEPWFGRVVDPARFNSEIAALAGFSITGRELVTLHGKTAWSCRQEPGITTFALLRSGKVALSCRGHRRILSAGDSFAVPSDMGLLCCVETYGETRAVLEIVQGGIGVPMPFAEMLAA